MGLTVFSRRTWGAVAMLVMLLLGSPAYTGSSAHGMRRGQEQPRARAPELQVEYVGSERGYAITGQSVAVLCVIRNVGGAALPENAARVRCYPLTGMDFMEGQLWPTLPSLAPGQAVAYRWRLAIPDSATPLVFSVLITRPEPGPGAASANGASIVPPQVAAVAIPRFASAPHLLGNATAAATPQASAARGGARVGNDRTLLTVVEAQDRVPVLALAGKEGADWRSVALGSPVVQVRSGEEGMRPWWSSFRWTDTEAREARETATLTLGGTVGPNWTARVVFESRAQTGVLYGIVRLTARRTMRLYGIRLPRFLGVQAAGAGPVRLDGTAALLPTPAPAVDADRLAAAHTGALTYGLTWPAASPLNGWTASPAPVADAEHLPVLGAEWKGDDRGEVVVAGATIDAPFRIFVFGPSDTVRDAARFRTP